MNCPECGYELDEGSVACGKCGAPQVPEVFSGPDNKNDKDNFATVSQNGMISVDSLAQSPGNRTFVHVRHIKKGAFFKRGLALYFDLFLQGLFLIILFMAGLAALKNGLAISGSEMGIEDIALMTGPLALATFIINMSYFTFFHWATGQTPGKKLNNLRVVTVNGDTPGLLRSFVRWAGYSVSAMPFMLGFLLALIDGQKQALHDKIAGTYVVDEAAWQEARALKEGQQEGDFNP